MPQNSGKGSSEDQSSLCPSSLPVEKAVASVCLIAVDNGVWASGVLLNDQGLVLTNAHLLEPWRFGKRTSDTSFLGVKPGGFAWSSDSMGSRKIRVRLNHTDPWTWRDAIAIYICKGSLDVALLQLESVPEQLFPMVTDFSRPSIGSKAYVIGHGLFGPRCGITPVIPLLLLS